MSMRTVLKYTFGVVLLVCLIQLSEGHLRCFACRSRGKLGDCRDHFPYNSTHLVQGVESIPCASGWCSKIIEGDKYGEDHDLATERSCLQRIPPDSTQRCAEVEWNKRKVYACFCAGNLCNGGLRAAPPPLLLTAVMVLGLALRRLVV